MTHEVQVARARGSLILARNKWERYTGLKAERRVRVDVTEAAPEDKGPLDIDPELFLVEGEGCMS